MFYFNRYFRKFTRLAALVGAFSLGTLSIGQLNESLAATLTKEAGSFEFLESHYPGYGTCRFFLMGYDKKESLYLNILKKTAQSSGFNIYPISHYSPAELHGIFPREFHDLLIEASISSKDLYYSVQNELIKLKVDPAKFSKTQYGESGLTLAVASVYYQARNSIEAKKIAAFLSKHIDDVLETISFSNFDLADLEKPWLYTLRFTKKDTGNAVAKDLYEISEGIKSVQSKVIQLGLGSDNRDTLGKSLINQLNRINTESTTFSEAVEQIQILYGTLAHLKLTGQISTEVLKKALNESEATLHFLTKRFESNIESIREIGRNANKSKSAKVLDEYFNITDKRMSYTAKFLHEFGSKLGVNPLFGLY